MSKPKKTAKRQNPRLFAVSIRNVETDFYRPICFTDDLGSVLNDIRVQLRKTESAYSMFPSLYEVVYWSTEDGLCNVVPFDALKPEESANA